MKPLQGVTILDISRLLPGGVASLILKEQGARVIKVEQPGIGDYYRAVVRTSTDGGDTLGGRQVHALNAGKETLGLDLKSDAGREIFKKLVRRADVVVESFRPGTLKRLKIDYTVLKKLNPRIILCSITGGQKGRSAFLAGHDLNYLGQSGLLSKIKDREGRPVIPDFQVVDLAAGQKAAMKVLAALFQRSKTRRGSWIGVSLEEAAYSLARLYPPRHRSFLGGGFMRYGVYETADGQHVTFAPLEQKFWERFCRLIGRPEWGDDPLRPSDREPEKEEAVRAFFRSRTKKELADIGLKEDVCLFPVEEISESFFARQKEFPPLGTHTIKILKSIGYKPSLVQKLKSQGVVA